MTRRKWSGIVSGMVLALGSGAWGSTVTFDVVTDLSSPQASVTVAPGAKVPYTLTVMVTPGNPTDTTSFGGGTVDLFTDLGVPQDQVTDFQEAGIFSDFFDPTATPPIVLCVPLLPTRGAPAGDDVLGIGWSQCVLGGGIDNLFLNQTSAFAIGELTTSVTEGTYLIQLAAGNANVMRLDLGGSKPTDEVILGPGFMVVVSAGGSPGGGGDGSGDGGVDDGSGDGTNDGSGPDPEPQPTPDPNPEPSPTPDPDPSDDGSTTGDPSSDDPTTGGDNGDDGNNGGTTPPPPPVFSFCGAGISAYAVGMFVGLWLMQPICSTGRRRRK